MHMVRDAREVLASWKRDKHRGVYKVRGQPRGLRPYPCLPAK